MLSDPLSVPTWQFAILAILAAVLILDKVVIPSVRWIIRRRLTHVTNKVNEHLQIGIRPFQLTKRKVLIDRLVFDSSVAEATEAHIDENEVPREAAEQEVRRYASEIVPAFNAFIYYRLIYRLCRFVCRQFYRVRVGVADEEEIRSIDRNATVVFVMNHRSNFDYLLVSYLVSKRTTMSYAAGEWAKVFLLQSVIRAMGAFFVRRSSGNALYRRVLERYVHMATREGVCQAVFLEGGLTKTGALATPKLGFLDYMLRGMNVDKDRDIVFIPVGINYDKVLEDKIQIKAGKGIHIDRSILTWSKTILKFVLVQFAKSRDRRRDLFGYASVNFGRVVSAKAFANQNGINYVSLDKETRFAFTSTLADKLMNGIGFVIPVLPVPLIAQSFRRTGASSMSELDVISEVHSLIDAMIELGAPLNDGEKPAKMTMQKSLAAMVAHQILELADGRYRVAADADDLLNYYADSIDHWFGGIAHINPLQHSIIETPSVNAG